MKNKNIVHHGGAVGKAASQLAKKSTSKATKSNASKKLNTHKKEMH